jgi:hypothetical protein
MRVARHLKEEVLIVSIVLLVGGGKERGLK